MADSSDYSLETIRKLIEDSKWEQVVDKCNEAILAIGEDKADAKYFYFRAKGNLEVENQMESLMDLRVVQKREEISVALRFDALVLKANCLFSLEEYESCKQTVKAAFAQRSDASLYCLINKCNQRLGLSLEQAPDRDAAKKKTYRHEWYQNETEIVITILIKNINQEDLTHEIKESRINVEVGLPNDESFVLKTDLFDKIVPSKSKLTLKPTKIDIRLKKANPGNWRKLEKENLPQIKSFNPQTSTTAPQDPQKFPSSSKTFKDWDKLAAQAAKEEAEEKPEGDAALNEFFQKIYGGGSDEQKRAMMKSFQESGGTVLSTNWDEVGKEKVEMKAPDGMEFKKYDK